MYSLFFHKINNCIKIDDDFLCSIEEFIRIETKLEIPDCFELHYNDSVKYIKQDINNIRGIDKCTEETILKIINNKNSYIKKLHVIKNPVKTLDELKNEKIKAVKTEASKRIDAIYPLYKQVNYGSAIMEILNKENYAVKQGSIYTLTADDKISLNKAKAGKDFISLIRSKSDTLEILINSKSTIETLNGIDIYDDYHWINK